MPLNKETKINRVEKAICYLLLYHSRYIKNIDYDCCKKKPKRNGIIISFNIVFLTINTFNPVNNQLVEEPPNPLTRHCVDLDRSISFHTFHILILSGR